MCFRFLRTLATWLCLVPCLISGLTQERGLVLCFGQDGHFDISALGDRCTACASGTCSPAADPCAGDIACDPSWPCCPCIDVPVESSGGILRPDLPRFAPELTGPFLSAPPASLFPPRRPGPVTPLGPPTWLPATSLPLTQLRSVWLIV